MFTGIVQSTAKIAWLERSATFLRYAVALPSPFLAGLKIGASISVHGICQTVVRIEENLVYFDAIEETLKRTTLQNIHLNQEVNIERAAKFGDEIGGHMLSGHIIGTAEIAEITHPCAEQRILSLRCNPEWMKYLLPKGYVALNGASLTLVDTLPTGMFTVHLIPETLRQTTFAEATIGEKVNVEIDTLTQTIVATVERVIADGKLK